MGSLVVHCKRERYDVYIGRPSVWGNPFAIGRDGSRAEVIAKFEAYLRSRPDLMAKLPELRGKVLGCWCAPQGCHGDVLAHYANAIVHLGKLSYVPCMALSYSAVHKRLRKQRGRAAGLECEGCAGAATDWAWVHDTDPDDTANYRPLCRSCHLRYDNVGGAVAGHKVSEETKRKIGLANSRKIRSPETRQQIALSVSSYAAGLSTEQRSAKYTRAVHETLRERQLTTSIRHCACGMRTNAGTMSSHLRAAVARGETGHALVHDLGAVSPSRIIIAGDWHGNALWAMAAISDAARLLADEEYPCIVVLGDFGLWPGTSGQQYLNALHDSLTAVNGRLYFIDGNHDDHARLASLLASSRMTGALPLDEDARVNWLPRNTRWAWHGREWLALGGAASVDKAIRHEGISWWPEEEITEEQARETAEAGRADVMVTHDCPAGVRHGYPPRMPSFWNMARSEAHQALLQGVVDAVQPRWLMHGHLHRAYQRECDFGYGPVEVTGLDCDGGKGLGANYLVLDVRTMTWENPAL